jgi:hypothetical protein
VDAGTVYEACPTVGPATLFVTWMPELHRTDVPGVVLRAKQKVSVLPEFAAPPGLLLPLDAVTVPVYETDWPYVNVVGPVGCCTVVPVVFTVYDVPAELPALKLATPAYAAQMLCGLPAAVIVTALAIWTLFVPLRLPVPSSVEAPVFPVVPS